MTLNSPKKILAVFLLFSSLLLITYILKEKSPEAVFLKRTTFVCAEQKKIIASIFSTKVDLILSDGRNLSLATVVSASGTRYANSDESIVFWNKDKDAFLIDGQSTTFHQCQVV